jgi:major membrane immunogen (membrane-anchored lipoprotein)
MRKMLAVGMVLVAVLAAGCGSSDEPKKKEKEKAMKVEDTAFGPLVGTPKKVEDRVNASQDQYRDSVNDRLEEDEGGKPKQDEPSGD